MEIMNQVIQLGNIDKSRLEQICFKCPATLKEDLKEIGDHYNFTVTSLIINACTIMVQDFKGGEVSSLNIQQSRACIKLDDLEEKLEPYMADTVNDDLVVVQGYPFDGVALVENQPKIERILNRIKNLKKIIGEYDVSL